MVSKMSHTAFSVSNMLIRISLVLLFVSPDVSAVLSNHVFGTIATSCGQALYHTPPNAPYPTWDSANGQPGWIVGPTAVCVRDSLEMLHYCREVYAPSSPDLVQQAILSPFTLANHSLPPYTPAALQSVQIYLCLGPSSSDSTSGNVIQPPEFKTVETTTQSTPRHLPSLVDVHRAYFADKFRRLANETATNVSQLVDQLRRGSEGLAKLYHSDPDLIRYSVSSLLQDAHTRLTKIWANEAGEWSRLEQARHEDLVRQFDAEDWAGENEFTYVLQESQLDLERVQDALTNLLNRLADSVHEEVRHLRLVQTHQPWTLASYQTNWTNHITHEFTNIERVHEVLLKHVRTATRAINTVRTLMIKQTEPQSESPRSLIHYKPAVLTSYNRLQSELFTAESAVSEAKATLLTNVTDRMHSLLSHMVHGNRSGSVPAPTDAQLAASDAFVSDWLQSVHHSELAFIDLLVSRIVGLPTTSEPLESSADHVADSLWRPAPSSDINPGSPLSMLAESFTDTDDDATDNKPSRLALHWLLALAFTALCCLFASLALLIVCCVAVRWGRRGQRGGAGGWVGAALDKSTHRLKHLAYRSRLFGSRTDTPTWKVDRHVVVLTGGQPAVLPGSSAKVETAIATPRVYTNPIDPAC